MQQIRPPVRRGDDSEVKHCSRRVQARIERSRAGRDVGLGAGESVSGFEARQMRGLFSQPCGGNHRKSVENQQHSYRE
uniref:Uncharacterized protein n=1 Tax=Physcomitrium patens TaxID=3218 RepID=A0A2K1IC46_PHYPA|nr:hypothetical protein PHYPA_030317 [Physcomitrium patens]